VSSFDGVFIPVTTPFSGDDVAPARLAANLQKWNGAPLAGYVVLGSTGEFPMLIAAREFCDVYALAGGGRWDEAREIARRMMVADRGIAGRYGIGGLKAALDLQGFYGGPCRAPLGTPDGDAIEDIKEVLATAGLL